jgi:hypothetical protein
MALGKRRPERSHRRRHRYGPFELLGQAEGYPVCPLNDVNLGPGLFRHFDEVYPARKIARAGPMAALQPANKQLPLRPRLLPSSAISKFESHCVARNLSPQAAVECTHLIRPTWDHRTLMVRKPSLPAWAMTVVSNHESPVAAAGHSDFPRGASYPFSCHRRDALRQSGLHGSRQRPSPTGDGRSSP